MSIVKTIHSEIEPPELVQAIVKLGFSNENSKEFHEYAEDVSAKFPQVTFYSLDIDDVETLKDVATESVFLFYLDNEKVDHVRGWDRDTMDILAVQHFGNPSSHAIDSEDVTPFECSHNGCMCGVNLSENGVITLKYNHVMGTFGRVRLSYLKLYNV